MTIQETSAARAGGVIALFTRLWAELKANRRAVLGLLAIGVLVAGYGLLALDDAVDAAREREIDVTHRLQRLVGFGNEQDWLHRAALSQEMRRTLESRLWHAENEGIGRAAAQDWVTKLGREAGLEKMRVSVDATKPTGLPVNYRAITATITALYTEASLVGFIDRIQREPLLAVVDHFQVHERPVPALEMKLIAYFVLGADQSTAK